jgi:hypothetical protein
LKRLSLSLLQHTRLKPGVNEMVGENREIFRLGLSFLRC